MSRNSLAVATRIFAEASFLNTDVGPLNEALDIDLFVISIPKCGTTAIQRGSGSIPNQPLDSGWPVMIP
jgi:hypothetical protein